MNIVLNQPEKESTFTEPATSVIRRISLGLIRTIWDYAEQRPSSIFICIEPTSRQFSCMVEAEGKFVNVKDLSSLESLYKFKNEEGRFEKLQEFFENDTQEINSILERHGFVLPTNIWLSANTTSDVKNIKLTYGTQKSAIEGMEEWARKLSTRSARRALTF